MVAAETGDDLAPSNGHGLDLRTYLVPPRRVACRNTFPELNKGKPLRLWVVLVEAPGRKDGDFIVFDEQRGAFGLADWDGGMPVFLGYHGGFLNTLQGM